MEIHVDGSSHRLFLGEQLVSYRDCKPASLHRHYHVEIHLILAGTAEYVVGNQHFMVAPYDYVVIPAMTFHRYLPCGEFSFQGFQVERFDTRSQVCHATEELFRALEAECAYAKRTLCCSGLAACMARLLQPLLSEGRQKLVPLQDRRYMIHEFLALHYNEDITLADVAEYINLSPKQTARLIEEYTGHPFRQEIVRRRMEVAGHLQESEELTMKEIAEKVGYGSYSSFWKAYHRQKLLNDTGRQSDKT